MPYYLVTYTSLIEAEDEVKAAQKVLAKLKSDIAVEFTVKLDEANIRQVLVADTSLSAPPSADDPQPDLETMLENIDCRTAVVDRDETPDSSHWSRTGRGIFLGISLFAAGLTMGMVVDLLT